MPGLIISKTFAWPRFNGLPTHFRAPPTSCPNQLGQAFSLLIFRRSKTALKSAKPSHSGLHRLPCVCGGRPTSLGGGATRLGDLSCVFIAVFYSYSGLRSI